MSYTKTNWTDGTTPLDASNMNKIEQGISDLNSDISTLNSNSLLSGGTQLSTTADCNEILTPGRYYTTQGQNNMTNFPYTAASFVLIVLQGISTTRVIQWLFPSSSNYLYYRYFDSTSTSTWNWKQISWSSVSQ